MNSFKSKYVVFFMLVFGLLISLYAQPGRNRILSDRDIRATNLERIFRYYDNRLNVMNATVPTAVSNYITNYVSQYVTTIVDTIPKDSSWVKAIIDTLQINVKAIFENSNEGGMLYDKSRNRLFLWADSQLAGNASFVQIGENGSGFFGIRLEGDLVIDAGCDEVIITEPLRVGETHGDGISISHSDTLWTKLFESGSHSYLYAMVPNKNLYLGVNIGGVPTTALSIIGTTGKIFTAFSMSVEDSLSIGEATNYIYSDGDNDYAFTDAHSTDLKFSDLYKKMPTTEPGSPEVGDMFFRGDSLHVYNGSIWKVKAMD
jgi:hypothetical protein